MEDWQVFVGAAVAGGVAGVVLERVLGRLIDLVAFRISRFFSKKKTGARTLSGIWKARFLYHSSESEAELEDEYLIVLKQGRWRVRGRSLKRPEESQLQLELALERSVLTGTWSEYTPSSGRTYHGACQLVLNSTGDALEGRWLGYDRNDEVGEGPWRWERVDAQTSRKAKRRFEHAPLAFHRPPQSQAATGSPLP